MLALNREPGSITDFYVNSEPSFSIYLKKADNNQISVHSCTHFEGTENVAIENEPCFTISALEGKANILMSGHRVELSFYQKKLNGPQIVSFNLPKEVHVVRREVLLRDGLEVCLSKMNNRS